MRAKKDMLEKKKTTMRDPSSNRDTESDSESYQSSSTDSDSESSNSSDSEHAVHKGNHHSKRYGARKRMIVLFLGRDDSDNVAVEGPIVVPSQPSLKEKE
ncbi:hypothetical protein PIB30_098279 [Stylosanthes scabra]|uniref:Uncharacterized protein n=1 Tax=Stylosanthes scabra TaxID=79078 RepID=A0ABU6SX88_9FABA|nr:hypothetical protein [Stylosanthes scabra]